jgi:hypothetical protein
MSVRSKADHYDVFISYRRESGHAEARLMREHLRAKNVRAFLDVDDLRSGHFDQALLNRIADTPNFIVILSPNSLDRCADKGDWLRQEIAEALRTSRNIIPVLLPKFAFPDRETLPEDIRDLPTHNGLEYSHKYFIAMIDNIIAYLAGEGEESKREPSRAEPLTPIVTIPKPAAAEEACRIAEKAAREKAKEEVQRRTAAAEAEQMAKRQRAEEETRRNREKEIRWPEIDYGNMSGAEKKARQTEYAYARSSFAKGNSYAAVMQELIGRGAPHQKAQEYVLIVLKKYVEASISDDKEKEQIIQDLIQCGLSAQKAEELVNQAIRDKAVKDSGFLWGCLRPFAVILICAFLMFFIYKGDAELPLLIVLVLCLVGFSVWYLSSRRNKIKLRRRQKS